MQRMRSLPMMLDTSTQHHSAVQGQARGEGRQPSEWQQGADCNTAYFIYYFYLHYRLAICNTG